MIESSRDESHEAIEERPSGPPGSERRLRRARAALAPRREGAGGVQPFGAAMPDEVLDDVVSELKTLTRAAGIEFAFRVGELVVTRLYAGALPTIRERGAKDVSFRRLARHPDLPFSAATLWRSVAIYELLSQMPGLRSASRLGLSHLHAVLGLPAPTQERLLMLAQREGWTAERLSAAAEAARRKEGGKGGRPRTPAALKSLQEFHRRLEQGEDHHDLLFLERMSEDDARELRAMALRMKAWCEQVAGEVERKLERS